VSTDEDNDGVVDNVITSAIPVENWPVLLVKGEIDPGIVEGSLFFSSWDPNLYDQAMPLPGRVRLVGTAMDPYTEELTGRHVEARGYTNASANGHYEVEGVAPGVYDVYASAAGYPETLVATGIKVLPGQSVHLDIALNPGAIIHGKIFAKHGFGDVNWPGQLPVTVEIYDSNEWPEPFPGAVWGDVDGTVPDNWLVWEQGTPTELVWTDKGYQPSSPAHLKSFSPINLTDAPYTSYVWGNVIFDATGLKLDPTKATARGVAFPWEGPSVAGAYEGKDQWGVFNGVGPNQTWWTKPGETTFYFQFGNKPGIAAGKYDADGDRTANVAGLYGCPTEFDGHVPQVFATWINGLTPGTYYMRVWINGFVQTDINGAYMDYVVHVAEQEWAGDIYVPIDVQLSGKIEKTIHFQAGPGSLAETKVGGPDDWRFVIVEARDAKGTLVAFNFTQVYHDNSSVTIELNGFGMAGPVLWDDWDAQQMPWHWGGPLVSPNGTKFFLYRYRHIRDYGLMPGTYKIYVYVRGFVQQEWEWASVSLSGKTTYISNHVYCGAGLNVTVWSIDWQHPKIPREWQHPGYAITIDVTNRDTGVGVGEVRFWNSTTGCWEKPLQRKGEVSAPWPGWKNPPGGTPDPRTSYLKFDGSVYLERAGPDETVGAWTPDPEDEATTL
ncbi:MAG: carboxypeptidase-like regulatory domain-containing protein, partial [Thermoproteus sp.]